MSAPASMHVLAVRVPAPSEYQRSSLQRTLDTTKQQCTDSEAQMRQRRSRTERKLTECDSQCLLISFYSFIQRTFWSTRPRVCFCNAKVVQFHEESVRLSIVHCAHHKRPQPYRLVHNAFCVHVCSCFQTPCRQARPSSRVECALKPRLDMLQNRS